MNKRGICKCGKPKDGRSKQCARCARISYPVDGEARHDYAKLVACIQRARSLNQAAALAGVSRHTITNFAKANAIDLSHMVAGRGRVVADEIRFSVKPRRDLTVRKYFRARDPENYLCSECGLGPKWNGRMLTLQMDHRNGNCCDDRLANLRWLCPNCHSQTDTYTGRNGRRKEV